jgi:hypothetical protein
MTLRDNFPLADAGIYVRGPIARAAAAQWARRHLVPHVPHYHPPGSGIIFRREDIDRWLTKYRIEPDTPPEIDLDEILGTLDRRPPRRRGPKKGVA